MKYKDLFIGIAILIVFYVTGLYLFQGQEESNAFYTKTNQIVKRHR